MSEVETNQPKELPLLQQFNLSHVAYGESAAINPIEANQPDNISLF